MTQEEFVKGLFFKDLCARLPYELKCQISYTFHSEDDNGEDIEIEAIRDETLMSILYGGKVFITDHHRELDIEHIKPYLRPLSSMTEEERKELSKLCDFVICCCDNDDFGHLGIEILTDLYDKDDYYVNNNIDVRAIDWLLSHHFDYQDLISKGLALVAPKDMYV